MALARVVVPAGRAPSLKEAFAELERVAQRNGEALQISALQMSGEDYEYIALRDGASYLWGLVPKGRPSRYPSRSLLAVKYVFFRTQWKEVREVVAARNLGGQTWTLARARTAFTALGTFPPLLADLHVEASEDGLVVLRGQSSRALIDWDSFVAGTFTPSELSHETLACQYGGTAAAVKERLRRRRVRRS